MKNKLLKWLAVICSVLTLLAFGVACAEDNNIGNLTFKTFSVYNNVASGMVSNDTDAFSFNEEITAKKGASFLVSADKFGEKIYQSKIVPLEVGDNFFYILETVDGDVKNTYSIKIRRKDIYTVSFDTQGGTEVVSQQVEEYDVAIEPRTTPTREGYTFVNWEFDFTKPITKNEIIQANWAGNPYTLTIIYGNGQPDEEKTVPCGSRLSMVLESPQSRQVGYTFAGWDVDIMPAEDTTVTATWQPIFILDGGTITGLTVPGKRLSEIEIPSQLNGVTITSIGEGAFSFSCSTNIVIPNSITSIGDSAFSFSLLTSIVIPDSVTSIGDKAFFDCYFLTSIKIPDSVTSIGDDTFYGCYYLTSIVIPDSVTSIGDDAFYDCSDLTSVYYKGTASEWNSMEIDDNYNEELTKATLYYYVENETDVPTDGGNYWHYEDGEPTAW